MTGRQSNSDAAEQLAAIQRAITPYVNQVGSTEEQVRNVLQQLEGFKADRKKLLGRIDTLQERLIDAGY